jgi:hypothetical protein
VYFILDQIINVTEFSDTELCTVISVWIGRHWRPLHHVHTYYDNEAQIMNKYNCSPSMSLLPVDKAAGWGDKHINSHFVRAPSHTTQVDTKQFSNEADETTGRGGCGMYFYTLKYITHRSQWPRGLRRGSMAARLLGLWVRIPPRAWMSVSCECCVLSGRGLFDGLVTRPEESYRVWCV